ncbi:MAG TPA: hypothetical protein VNL14_14180 [Candidatus Acidoferrales bacterium]|nr:hypothetical protein [Candidatus Acidoferrales bacterium]
MKQLVLAGDRDEFEAYCERHRLDPNEALFLQSADQLRGIDVVGFEFVKLPNWHRNPVTNTREFWTFLETKHPRFRDAE